MVYSTSKTKVEQKKQQILYYKLHNASLYHLSFVLRLPEVVQKLNCLITEMESSHILHCMTGFDGRR